jgi:hypothetical protein
MLFINKNMSYDQYNADPMTQEQAIVADVNDDIADAMAIPIVEQPTIKKKKRSVEVQNEPISSSSQVVNDMTADDLYESQQIEAKIRRLAVEFPELKLEEEPEFAQLTGQYPETLQRLYEEWCKRIPDLYKSSQIVSLFYVGLSSTLENLISKTLINVQGATQLNINESAIQTQIRMINVEYGLTRFMPSNPLSSLAMLTAMGFVKAGMAHQLMARQTQPSQPVQPPQPDQPDLHVPTTDQL